MVSRDVIQRLLNVLNDTRQRVGFLESRATWVADASLTVTNKIIRDSAIFVRPFSPDYTDVIVPDEHQMIVWETYTIRDGASLTIDGTGEAVIL